jgi:hypothetical protein
VEEAASSSLNELALNKNTVKEKKIEIYNK